LAFFVNAGSFKDSVMLAFLNNQNIEALEFLKALVDQIKMPYFRSQQEKKHLSLLQNMADMAKQPPTKKKKHVSYELLQMQAMKTSSNEFISSMVYVAKYPNILTNQQAGYYCKGALTSTDSIKVLVKKTHQGHNQQNEIRALEALSGLQGIPTVLGKIIIEEETRLVFEDTDAVPCRTTALNAEQNDDLMRIKNEMKNRGWSLHIRDQNVWLNAKSNTVMLFNFETASCIPESVTGTPSSSLEHASYQDAEAIDNDGGSLFDPSISDNGDSISTKLAKIKTGFLAGCCGKPEAKRTRNSAINQKETVTNPVSGAAPTNQAIETFGSITRMSPSLTDGAVAGQTANASLSSTTYSVIIQRERDFSVFTGVRYSKCLRIWDRKSKTDQFDLLSKLWTRTHDDLYPTMGPGLSWDRGIPYRGSRGYGTASLSICFFLASVHKKYNASHSFGPTNLQTFVDIGSGVCNIVLKMSVLMHDFRMCFGIEIVPFRAKFAQSACQSFASNAAAASVPFCKIIQAETGDACANRHSQEALESAGLVWINNEIFGEEDNMKIFELLNALVPVGCVIATFQPLLQTKRNNPQVLVSPTPCDFTVHSPEEVANACSWGYGSGHKCVFIIQRTSRLFHNKKYYQ
jgi:hypothetical protein